MERIHKLNDLLGDWLGDFVFVPLPLLSHHLSRRAQPFLSSIYDKNRCKTIYEWEFVRNRQATIDFCTGVSRLGVTVLQPKLFSIDALHLGES